MTAPRSSAIFRAVIAAGFVIASVGASALVPQERHHAHPARPSGNHPVPGPFWASVDQRGTLEDVGVVENALRSWARPPHSAFSLCFRSSSRTVDWTQALAALRNTSRELKARGAAVVVVDSDRLCGASDNAPIAGKSGVEITGVLLD